METARAENRRRARSINSLRALAGLCLLGVLLAPGCGEQRSGHALSQKAKLLWESGQYADAARNFVTLAEINPSGPLAEESLYWAANLYQHFIKDNTQAIRFYQQLLVQFPGSIYTHETMESLALLYEEDKASRHRALQIYQQLLLSKEMKARRDYFQFKIGALNLKLGIMDQARFEFRNLITQYPKSSFLPESYYLVGYSYFLEKRYPLALVAFRQTSKDFPSSPLAIRAQFFVAETLEEQGMLKPALKTFRSLEGKYHNQKILRKRIKSLMSRMRKGVR